MTIFKKLIVVSISALFLLVALVFLSSITGGIVGDCSEDELSRAMSPTREYEAIVLRRDCGATTPVASHVQLSRIGTQQTEFVFTVESSSHLSVSWDDTNILEITFLAKDRKAVFKKLIEWEKVKINYEVK